MIRPITRKNSPGISAIGAVVTVLCGILLWSSSLGDPWVNASYDYLFRFGSHAVTNKVALILMDNAAFDHFHQTRRKPWDRGLHAQVLNRLADDGCPMVVLDSFFREPGDPSLDEALAGALRRQRHVFLMAEQSQVTHPGLAGAQPILPWRKLLDASGTNWGVAWLDPDPDFVVRRHWPFPSPGPYPSLPWVAARAAGARLSDEPQERWLRYYGQYGAWPRISYQFALTQPAGYFSNQIVFIGTQPGTSLPDGENDEFSTPYTRWTFETSGGVEVLLTSFLNLLNRDWLQRPSRVIELITLVAAGGALGGGLCRLRLRTAVGVASGVLLIAPLSVILLSYYNNRWFPWLIIDGGQVPCALAWGLVARIRRAAEPASSPATESLPDTPGYQVVHPPFGEGAYGKVWLARNTAGQWRALKVIYLAKFDNDPDPYEREFNGVKKYQPISDKHPALLRVEFVSEKQAGCFFYTMELGDPLEPGWERAPSTYKPQDLVSRRAQLPGRRLPVKECIRVGILLTEALGFLHSQGMTHRDIKPQNIIFVNGQPKLADLGLITEIRSSDRLGTLVGTPGYMPPPPERPGTVQADIYALGMVLYVSSTGRSAALFPEVATTLVSTKEPPEFLHLNAVILKACQPLLGDRFSSAAEFRAALEAAQAAIERNG